jgi:DNA (cytosine-5)-methyltransferase 1
VPDNLKDPLLPRQSTRGGAVGRDKPPYRVPSMREIAMRRQHGLTVVSLFSGCGGSCLGFRMAGYRVLWANEFVEEARTTYEANKAPYTVVDPRDVRQIKPEEILAATKLRSGELDVLEGSPPCSAVSMVGSREAGWGQKKRYSIGVDKTEQRTDDLFFEFARILRGLQPKTFVAENVWGLVKGAAKELFGEIYRELAGCGYVVNARLLDAQWLGVPQVRKRVIMVGVRNDLGLQPVYPAAVQHRYSIADALAGLEAVVPEEASIERYAIGSEWHKLRPGQQSARYFQLIRPDRNLPCPTITAAVGYGPSASVCHPYEPRKFTPAELRRICGFPDDFRLTGDFQQQCERLGRAVPPPMMHAIAEVLRDQVLRRHPAGV